MTGDRDAVAARVADDIGIDQYWSGLTPSGKADCIKALQQNGAVVAMVSTARRHDAEPSAHAAIAERSTLISQ